MIRLAAPNRTDLASGAKTAYQALRRAVPHDRWSALRRHVPPALRYTLRRKLSVTPPSIGTISVIVPCYNVEPYLKSCLTSIIAQSYTDLEIIVVIDGSPDRSVDIARGFARWDRRIKVIEQANAGLGAARNTGIRAATGDLIAFVDSDDWLPPDAYLTMTRALEKSGSDFVVGNLERKRGPDIWVPVWARDVHRHDRLGLTLADYPEILADVFSWNKLFRRPFFNRAVGGFPEGIRYEDQEPTAKAYAAASSFDVLSEITYRWFIRGDGSSITQQKSNLADLQDRLTVMRQVADVLTTQAGERVVRYWQAKAVGLDLRAYYNEVPRTGIDYWELLREGVRYVTAKMDEDAWALVDLHDRLLARMVEADARDDVCTTLVTREELGDGVRVDLRTGPPTGYPLYLDRIDFEPQAADLLLSPNENRLKGVLTGYTVDDGLIQVTGMVFLPGADLADATLTARLLRRSDRTPLPAVTIRLERFASPELDEIAGNAAASHAGDGFRATIEVQELLDALAGLASGTGKPAEVYLELAVEAAGRTWRNHLTQHDRRGGANRLLPGPLVGEHRIAARYGDDVGLRLRRVRAKVVAEAVEVTGRTVRLGLRSPGSAPVDGVTVRCASIGLTATADPVEGTPDVYSVNLPGLPPGAPPLRQHTWRVTATVGGDEHDIAFAGAAAGFMATSPNVGLRARVAASGRLELLDRKHDALVSSVEVAPDGNSFSVNGLAMLPPGQDLLFAFVAGSEVWRPESTDWDQSSGRFRATFHPVRRDPAMGELVVPTAGYSLRLLTDPHKTSPSLWIPVVPGCIPDRSVPFLGWHPGRSAAIRFTITAKARALWINVRPPLPDEDAGRLGQLRLQQTVPALLRSPIREVALFSCFGGRAPADSPLAIQQELQRAGYDGRILWATADGAGGPPAGVDTVLLDSPDYYEALHTSRWLVNNNNFPYYFRKHADQYYLQTWHGTPLKRIGDDVPLANLSLSYRSLMKREAAAWDALLAQNDFAAEVFPGAFGYDGPVLTLGYPRNDQLALTTPERQLDLRARLGIPPEGRVILYAPTWRDNQRTSDNRYAAVTYLDIDQVSRSLGDNGVLLLRGHSNTPGFSTADVYPNVRDLSRYPDIADLLEITDVLVTDYSSVMFDFAVTGRPIVFLAPDLVEYESSTRGFYLDFRAIAPGPILETTDDVVAAVSDPDALSRQYGSAYTAFTARFAPTDDGHAARRVVDHVWSSGR